MKNSNFSSNLLLLVLVGFLIFFAYGKLIAKTTVIAGTVNFNRLEPDKGDEGEIFILYRPFQSESDFIETGVVTQLKDEAPWSWNKAEEGKTYEIKARLQIGSEVIKDSSSLVVSAPAKNEELTLSVTWEDLPKKVVDTQKVDMGGTIKVYGYIPTDASLEVQTKTAKEPNFLNQWTSDDVKATNTWQWEKAVPNTKYQMRALLISENKVIGESATYNETGVKTDEVSFLINSEATNPNSNKKATISGNLTINGPEEQYTSALIMWSPPGANKWTEIARLKDPKNGTQTWQWTEAKAGVDYEIGIDLQVNEKSVATTTNKIVTAPAHDVDFTLNTGVNVPTPNNKPSLDSCGNNENNQWDANLVIPVNKDYGNYWWQIGTDKGAGNVYNGKVKPPTNDDFVRLTIKAQTNQTLYARYAYSFCSNCSDDANFSNFSDSLSFSCSPQPPQPTAKPQPTTKPQPTATLTPTKAPTATPTLPPKTSRCNEACGSNGYSCVLGLQCVSTDVPGQSACRNPNCPDKENCSCL
jgi:hypothetical protein